jgi:carbon storage regulator
MLVLTRKAGQSILIDGNIEVCILEVSEGAIKIGINAPKSVKVLRKEIISEVKNQNIESIKDIGDLIKKLK